MSNLHPSPLNRPQSSMPTLQLKTAQTLQGEFRLRALNLLVVFQVNCPGCFVYALPLAATLHHRYGDRLNVLGLSTAFEDFDLNTAEHTQWLLERGEIVGATKLHFRYQGESSYTVPIRFPVAFDQVGSGAELFDEADVEHVCHLTPSFVHMDLEKQSRIRARVRQQLQGRSPAAYTFSVNQFQGTPSWVLFDANSTILAQWFGHQSESEVMSIVDHVSDSMSLFQRQS